MQRPRDCRCGNTLRQRYDEVGLPCSSTMGSPSPTSTYAISLPRTLRRCFWYGNAAEIMLASPFFVVAEYHRDHVPTTIARHSLWLRSIHTDTCRAHTPIAHSIRRPPEKSPTSGRTVLFVAYLKKQNAFLAPR